MATWEYAEMVGKKITSLGKALFKEDRNLTEHGAWSQLGNDGWELVSVVADPDGEFHYFFKRPIEDKSKK